MTPGPTILQARDISKWFESGSERRRILVLDRINLSVRSGEIVALLGPSGSGKTTFLRIVSGLVMPSDGQVMVHDKPLSGVNPAVAVVFQSFALFPWLTVLENVMMGLLAKGMDRKAARDKAVQTIDMIGLDGFEDALPKEISGGMKQRVGFARALAMEPELLCMDEPFSGLDVLTAENLRGELLDLWTEHKIPTRAMLMITHNIEEAVLMADRVVILWHNPGRVADEIGIGQSHPRDRKSPEFKKIVDRIYTVLSRPSELESQGKVRPLALRKFQKLPQARVGAMTGLLELVHDLGGREDIYRLEANLGLEADELLPLTEAASLLGFAAITEGDISLTELGQRFVNGDILERKEVFREAFASTVVLANQVLQALRASQRGSMNEEFFLELLENHFTRDEAERQMATVIDWARYAEIFAYDEEAGVLYLEQVESAAEKGDENET